MTKILISDTHYGVKNNSMTWFKYQVEFVYKQLIPYIESLDDEVRLYHLGDVFESRSSINPYIATRVRQMFFDLSRVCDSIYIIGGNHDYYSPVEDEHNTNTLNLILSEIEGVNLFTRGFFVEKPDLFVPWFRYEDTDELAKLIKEHDIKNVFCHADLTHIDNTHQKIFKGVNVYSGHIHTPEMRDNLHTLGSTYALTFTDCNSERGFYSLKDGNLEFHPNEHSIRFWRFRDKDVFGYWKKVKPDDYIELYINQKLLLVEDYIEEIKKINKQFHNVTIIPVSEEYASEETVNFETYDIEHICKENIPKELLPKFEKVLEKFKQQLDK